LRYSLLASASLMAFVLAASATPATAADCGCRDAVRAALAKDLVTPIIAAIVGKRDFSNLTFTINKSRFFYGDFINAAVQFVLIAAAIYVFVLIPIKKLSDMQARRRAAGEPEGAADISSDEAILLREIRDMLSAPHHA